MTEEKDQGWAFHLSNINAQLADVLRYQEDKRDADAEVVALYTSHFVNIQGRLLTLTSIMSVLLALILWRVW
ncbi:MAG: hypothetical protein VYA17_12400 [Pseudomonadota bacterium]|nr:hypothetical protein [Pseudomonadota bacterium]